MQVKTCASLMRTARLGRDADRRSLTGVSDSIRYGLMPPACVRMHFAMHKATADPRQISWNVRNGLNDITPRVAPSSYRLPQGVSFAGCLGLPGTQNHL